MRAAMRAFGNDRLRAESPKQEYWKRACRGLSALSRYVRETYGDAIGYSVAAPLALNRYRNSISGTVTCTDRVPSRSESASFGLVLTLLALAFLITASVAGAEPTLDSVWSGLVFATNEDHPAAPPQQLAPFEQKLKRAFGYNQIQLLSEHRELMDEAIENWLLLGKGFCVSVVVRKEANRHYLLTLRVFQEKRLLVETRAKLAPRSPLVVRGPLYGEGQLVLVLFVE